MKKIIKISEHQLNNIIKNVINEGWVPGLDWFDPEYNDAFDDITDEKIIAAFEEYGLCADEEKCHNCKIEYHSQGDAVVYFDTYDLDGEFPNIDELYRILRKICDKIGAEKVVILDDDGIVKFQFYDHLKTIE